MRIGCACVSKRPGRGKRPGGPCPSQRQPLDRDASREQSMTERAPALGDAAIQLGLLMESAQAHQKLAEGQLQRLRAHTQDLDGVVRDEIRRTLVEELRALSAEAARA